MIDPKELMGYPVWMKPGVVKVFPTTEVEMEFTHEVMAERDGELHPIIAGFTGFNRDEAEARARKLNANRENNPFVIVSRLDKPVEAWGA